MKRPGKMLRQVLQSAVARPATVPYPFVPIHMPEKFRGRLAFCAEKCIGCKICMRDCPSKAIEIVKLGDKQFEARIDLARCIYCAQCVESCPKDALEATTDYELAQLTRNNLKVAYHGEPKAPATPPAATTAPATDDGKSPNATPVDPAKG